MESPAHGIGHMRQEGLQGHPIFENLGPVRGAALVIRFKILRTSLISHAGISDREGLHAPYHGGSEIAGQIAPYRGIGSQSSRYFNRHVFNDIGSTGTIVELSFYKPVCPRPVIP